jgi:hypothetical protein
MDKSIEIWKDIPDYEGIASFLRYFFQTTFSFATVTE